MVFWPQMGLSISLPPPSIPPLNTHLLSESKRRAIFAWIRFEMTSCCCSCSCECSLFSTFDSHSCSNGENRMKLLWEEGSMRGPCGTRISTGFVRRRIMIGLTLFLLLGPNGMEGTEWLLFCPSTLLLPYCFKLLPSNWTSLNDSLVLMFSFFLFFFSPFSTLWF